MKLALVGTGMIVKEVLPVLKGIKGIELAGICSSPRSLNQAHDLAKVFAIPFVTCQFDDLLEQSTIDTIYIGTPNKTHYGFAKQALLAGKHVICEKPFTMTVRELDELVTIAEQNQLILLEAITNQYLGNFHFIRKQLATLGDIKIIDCNFSQYSSRYDAFKRGEIAPAFNLEMGGGALRDLNIYNIHLIVGLFGKPMVVTYQPNMESGVDTSGILLMDYGSFKAVAIAAKDCSADTRTSIQGDKGTLTIIGPTNSMPEIQLTLNGEMPTLENHNTGQHRMTAEFVAFERMIREMDIEARDQALEHSRAVMSVLEAASQMLP
ncbi:Gfo/Idh/MocA family protein [Streptococcus plurextorum]|uniref:Gfo/Idh/MocA family protein n=1 Tax=Streptococcus plurextorum TaxID=456876 RepID=UPI0003F85507|nr:Gfo/Idh/MocA family oxidoreductase [Streptococcus plurextorum]